MLLVHQEGGVKLGQVVRYTLTYTPALDQRTTVALHLRIKNTSAIPYRAAYLVGPYTIHVSAYPSTFNPYQKVEDPRRDGVPQFEPNLKAGGYWHATLNVPPDLVKKGSNEHGSKSVTWIIEIASQMLFSDTASVHYELLVARDARSLDTGFAALASRGHGEPGKVQDLVLHQNRNKGDISAPKGVYSSAVSLIAEDTSQLWNKPALPQLDMSARMPAVPAAVASPGSAKVEPAQTTPQSSDEAKGGTPRDGKPRKKIHLVVLTHGLHSNVGADMLYMKESIDATVAQARAESKRRRAEQRKQRQQSTATTSTSESHTDPKQESSTAPLSGGQDELSGEDEDLDDEQVIVRGFSGNAIRTEKGIQYLGKRLAKYILTLTFPDQPCLPRAKSMTRSFSISFPSSRHGSVASDGENAQKTFNPDDVRPFVFTSISFIGHSLGGLIQLYAIGYIQKHSPEFFQRIRPINFVTMAAPLLGLSNENPMYVKFALDFGLVGRTGQDLGLTWRAPTIARNGWNAVFSGFGFSEKEQKQPAADPRTKPLLRILPSGPAHHVLRMFRNRTVYSNVVNDGIVPLRTSCLLFLDWRGLGRVENARRDNGLLGTMAQFGWAELTGANTISHKPGSRSGISMDSTNLDDTTGDEGVASEDQNSMKGTAKEDDVPTPSSASREQFLGEEPKLEDHEKPTRNNADSAVEDSGIHSSVATSNPFHDILRFLRPKEIRARSSSRAIERAQVVKNREQLEKENPAEPTSSTQSQAEPRKPRRPLVTRGSSLRSNGSASGSAAPPKTSIFEAAGDIISPPIPTISWLTDPSSRSRTIFHDRIYHPEDIPPPPQKRSRRRLSRPSSDSLPETGEQPPRSPSRRTRTERELGGDVDASGMKVEEKIARAYHRDLSWRKVLVRLEPDAHNNMIVRRMFANAYGWDVVRHLCDTHFADTYAARAEDADEGDEDRARPAGQAVGRSGDMVAGQRSKDRPPAQEAPHALRERGGSRPVHDRTTSEAQEALDEVTELGSGTPHPSRRLGHKVSSSWSDDFFEGTDDEWDDESNDEHP